MLLLLHITQENHVFYRIVSFLCMCLCVMQKYICFYKILNNSLEGNTNNKKREEKKTGKMKHKKIHKTLRNIVNEQKIVKIMSFSEA